MIKCIQYFLVIFSLQAEKDRGYLVKANDEHREVKLKGQLVQFLIKLNTDRAPDANMDKVFIKALLIAVFTVKRIKSGAILEPELMKFIEGSICNAHNKYFLKKINKTFCNFYYILIIILCIELFQIFSQFEPRRACHRSML